MIIRPSNRLSEVSTYYFATKLAQIDIMNQQGRKVINLGIGSPDLEPPEEVLETLKHTIYTDGVNSYQSYRGIPELRLGFAQWYKRHYNTELNPNKEILPLIGSKEGIMHISMSFLQNGDQVLIPNPGYPAYRMTTILAGAEPVFYDLDEQNGWLPDLKKLEEKNLSRVKIMWINYPHMPTGATASREIFEELVHFAKRYKILLCHDNPYSFILNNNPTSILEVEGAMDVAIELNSLSKCFNMAGWRIGVMCGHEDYIKTVMKFKSNMDSGMYKPIQLAATKALSLANSWYEELNVIYQNRREKAWKIMELLDCTYDKKSAGLFVWAKVPGTITDVEQWMERILHESGVFITPGFIFGTNGRRYLRISLCNKLALFEHALARIEESNVLTKVEI